MKSFEDFVYRSVVSACRVGGDKWGREGGRDVLDDVSEDSDSDEVEGQAVYCIQGSEEQDLNLREAEARVSE